MIPTHDSRRKSRGHAYAFSPKRWPLLAGLILLQAGAAWGGQAAAGEAQMRSLSAGEILTFFFLMLGPIKIIGPFAKLTQGADRRLAHQIAWRAILFSIFALLLAALVGESTLAKYNIPLPVLALAGGVVLFLVALQGILQQFTPPAPGGGEAPPATLRMAITPIAFPTIVTPYGIAALIIFVALSPDWRGKLAIGGILLVIMLLNVAAMLLARRILHSLGVFLQILGAILGIIQVALGLEIILNSLQKLWP